MENLNMPDPESKDLNLDAAGIGHLKETRTWTLFLSIMGFVFLGLMLIFGFIGSSLTRNFGPPMEAYRGMGQGFLLIMILIMVVIYFFPIWFLYNFSRYSKMAIDRNDPAALTESMRYLKLHYRYMGILIIVFFSIYLLAIVFGLMAGRMISLFNT